MYEKLSKINIYIQKYENKECYCNGGTYSWRELKIGKVVLQ